MKTQTWINASEQKPDPLIPVIVFVEYAGAANGIILLAIYAPEKTLLQHEDWQGDEHWDEETGEYWAKEGWYEHVEYDVSYRHINGDVTHWQNIPLPPETKL